MLLLRHFFSAVAAGLERLCWLRNVCSWLDLLIIVAGVLFDDENSVVRLDMSEYSESPTTVRLIGASPGYVGHDSGGFLTEALRRKPYSVVLLDEIEKAHQNVITVLLGMLDNGVLTSRKGEVCSSSVSLIEGC
jgi:ATP-dependent Clp protease ATP-binding subunit ClpA